MLGKLFLASDESTFFKKAAQSLLESAAAAVEERSQFTLVLSGGSTPLKLFSLLADPYYRNRISWQKTYVFWGDERCVPPTHLDSNYRAANEALLAKSGIPDSHVFRIPGEMESPQEAARSYQDALRTFFNLDKSLPQFDFIFLGVGEDGHTASLFPGTPALKEHTKWVTAQRVEKLNADRITLTLPLINNARRIVFLCRGASKAEILKEIFREDRPQDRFPAQLVNPVKGELIWLVDKAAASKLPPAVVQASTPA